MKHWIGITLVAMLASSVLHAAPLPTSSQEYLQLVAMGYDIQAAKADDIWTIAKSENARVVVSKTDNSLTVARFFTRSRKNLTKDQQFDLFKIVNQINTDLSYQVTISDEWLLVASYYTGPYNAKVFAHLVQQIEKVDVVFDKYPELIKLINK